MQPLWKTIWKILRKLKIKLPYDVAILLLDIHPENTNTNSKRYVHPIVYSGTICNSQDCILSSCLFNLYAEYIMLNAGLDESKAGIKIAGRNINNLRYADVTTLMAESKEKLKGFLMKVKEESEKAG